MRRRLLTGTRISPDRNHTADGHDFPNANRKAGQPVYYRGKYKIFAVLTQLVARVQPTEALLAGGSAGGCSAPEEVRTGAGGGYLEREGSAEERRRARRADEEERTRARKEARKRCERCRRFACICCE